LIFFFHVEVQAMFFRDVRRDSRDIKKKRGTDFIVDTIQIRLVEIINLKNVTFNKKKFCINFGIALFLTTLYRF
jgi:hypothetical protein